MPIRRKRKQPATSAPLNLAEGLTTGPDRGSYAETGSGVTGIYLSPDHQHLAVVTRYTSLAVYRLDGERLGEKVASHEVNKYARVKWSNSGAALAFVSDYFRAAILDVASREIVTLGHDQLFDVTALAFFPDGARLAIVGENGLDVWNVTSRQRGQSASFSEASVSDRFTRMGFEISPDGRWAAFSAGSGIHVLDAESLQAVSVPTGRKHDVRDLEWLTPEILATALGDGTVRIWRLPDLREVRVLEAEGPVYGIAHSPTLGCLIGWTRTECFFWSTSSWEIL